MMNFTTSNKYLGDLLLEKGIITAEELKKAMEEQKNKGYSLEKIIIDLGYATEKEITEIIGKEMGVSFIDLDEAEIDPEMVRSIPEHLAQRYKVIPVSQDNNKLSLAMVDPLNVFAIDDIRLITGFDIEPLIATEDSVIKAINDFFPQPFYYGGAIYAYTDGCNNNYDEKKPTEGTMKVKGKKDLVIPLKRTDVKAHITGMIADVRVTQKFYNDLSDNIEAVYMFPLSPGSAVTEFEIIVDKRVIKSKIKEKEEAKNIYEKARNEMKKTALLQEQKSDLFTLSVANIEPGQEIIVNIRYHETVKCEEGVFEFLFPMTVTPKYAGKEKKGVPDFLEGKTSPPVLKSEKDCGREISISVNLDAGFEIGDLSSPGHEISVRENGKSLREIEISGEIPNKDFILKYSPKGEELEKNLTFYREENKSGTFMFHLVPKVDYGPEEIVKREMIFVLDRSGSMCGPPMDQAREALKKCLRTLRGGDSFSIITFDDRIEYLSERSMEFNDKNLIKADNFIDRTDARGGTEILLALKYAFAIPESKDSLRQIVFLTDGAVWDEDSSLKEVVKSLGNARIFTFGIGPSVNRYFLSKMASLGRGTEQFITFPEELGEAIENFSKQTSRPVLCDLSIEVEGIALSDMYPLPIPDLYCGETLYLLGRFHSSGRGKAVLFGRTRNEKFREEFTVEFPEKDDNNPVIETVWAKKRVEFLKDLERENPANKHDYRDEILSIGLKYNLITPYTSLVAVEDVPDKGEREKKEIVRIDVPQVLPEGLNYNACMGFTDLCEVHETVKDIAMSDFGDLELYEEDDDIALDKLKELVDEAPIIRVLNLIITQAINDNVSDIHIEPREKNVCVRYRIDGTLQEIMSPPKHIQAPLITRIKIMANLDVAKRDMPQEGIFSLIHDGKEYEATVTVIPTVKGEKVVMTLRNKENILLDLKELGFTDERKKSFQDLMDSSYGLVLFTGPPGNGKTTTLYNGLNMLIGSGRNICIVEDKVDYNLPGIRDVYSAPGENSNVLDTLGKAIYKEHDTIVIGDLKDIETVKIAVKTALAKHLVLSSLEAEDTFDAINRLMNMGAEPSLLASSVRGIVSQRLVNKICPQCRESYSLPEEVLSKFKFDTVSVPVFYRGRGCGNCNGKGFAGKCGIYEVITFNDKICSLINRNAPPIMIKDEAIASSMTTLKQDCFRKVLEGITTIEEYLRLFPAVY